MEETLIRFDHILEPTQYNIDDCKIVIKDYKLVKMTKNIFHPHREPSLQDLYYFIREKNLKSTIENIKKDRRTLQHEMMIVSDLIFNNLGYIIKYRNGKNDCMNIKDEFERLQKEKICVWKGLQINN
jgi:hypothetical protein